MLLSCSRPKNLISLVQHHSSHYHHRSRPSSSSVDINIQRSSTENQSISTTETLNHHRYCLSGTYITMLSTIAACLVPSVNATIIHRDRYVPSSPYRYPLYTVAAASSHYLLIHFDAELWAHLLCIAVIFLHIAITSLCRRYMYRRISRGMYDRVPGRRSGLTMRINMPMGW